MENSKYFYYKKSRMSQLRSFCAVVQNDCIAVRAAKEINVEPATITKQIQSLESDLNLVLFDRSEHKKLKLTKEGELFYNEAVKHLNGINSLFDNFSGKLKEYGKTHLNIALYETAAAYVFPDIISNLLSQKKFENVNVKIMEITRDEAIKRLKNKEIDFAYFPFDISYEIPIEFNAIKNIRNNHAIVLGKNHSLANKEKITAEDLGEYDFITRGKNISFSIDEYLELKHSNVSFENCSMDTSIEFARALNCMTGIPEKIFKLGNLKYNKDIVCINSNNLFKESYFQILTLKNFTMKYSTEFVIKELKKLVKN